MYYMQLPTTDDARQTIYLPVSPDGTSFMARIELRYLPAPGKWFLSISDAYTGKLYANQIPVICSYETLNDLLIPFRWLFQGSGLGSFFCVKAVDSPATPDPSRENLTDFILLWGDRWVNQTG